MAMSSEFAVGVHALVFLCHKKTTLSSELLAENVCTNPARIRKVLAKLKKAGLVSTKEGLGGGYCFTLDPARVTLRQVEEAVEERLVYAAWKPGNTDMECLVASGMAGVLDGIYADLDELCKRRLGEITIQDIENQIFAEANA